MIGSGRRRVRLRGMHLLAVLLVGLLLSAPARTVAEERVDWPMARGDAAQRAWVRLPGRAPDGHRVRAWQFEASRHVWGYQPGITVWSSPAIGLVGGQPLVLVGSYDRNIYALDARTGEKVWHFTTGGGVYSTPVLWHTPSGEPRVFAASSDRMVYALGGTVGERLWIHVVSGWRPTLGGARLGAPCVGQAGALPAVFVSHWVWDKSMSGHMQAAGVTALSVDDGRVLWTTWLGDNRLASPLCTTLGPGRSRVFVGSDNGNLYALDASDGKQLWAFTDRGAVAGSPALYRQAGLSPTLLFGSKYGRLRALDAETGKERWRFATSHWLDGGPMVASVAGQDLVFAGSYDTRLYALDARGGRLVWSTAVAGGIYSAPALAPDKDRTRVLFSAWDHHLHCVDALDGALDFTAYTGRPIWDSLTLGDSTWSSPAVAELDGTSVAYVGSYAGPFYALPLGEAEKKALARPGSNLNFWLGLPVVLILTTSLALAATRRRRHHHRAG